MDKNTFITDHKKSWVERTKGSEIPYQTTDSQKKESFKIDRNKLAQVQKDMNQVRSWFNLPPKKEKRGGK